MVVKRNRELVIMLRVEKKYYLEKNDYQLLLGLTSNLVTLL